MKFLASFFLTALLSFAGSLFLPWWIIAIASFVVAFFIYQKAYKAFLSGFLALFLLWGVQAFIIDVANNHLLATKIASVLPLQGSYFALIIVTAFIGAIVAGMAALSGSFGRRMFTRSKA